MRILRLYRRGGTKSAAFQRCNVDRNTIAGTASAELQTAVPQKYEDLEKEGPQKLSVFSSKCAAAILEDPTIVNQIKVFKSSGKLTLKDKGRFDIVFCFFNFISH